MRRILWVGAIVCGFIANACATASPPPTKQMVESRAAVQIAEQAGAAKDTEAAQYLALARRQIADAERLMTEGSHWSANRVLESAHVHAELAAELARRSNARAEAESTKAEIERLQSRVQ
jgi:hypothetical protein